MDRTIAELLSATIGGYFTNWWDHPTFCVIIDESHIAVTQNIGCSPLLSLQVVCQKVCWLKLEQFLKPWKPYRIRELSIDFLLTSIASILFRTPPDIHIASDYIQSLFGNIQSLIESNDIVEIKKI